MSGPFLGLFVLLSLSTLEAQRISKETYQDVKVALKTEVFLRDPIVDIISQEPNDPFAFALWHPQTETVWFWTNGPNDPPQVYKVQWSDLSRGYSNETFPYTNTSFPRGEYSVQAAVYNPTRDILVMSAAKTMYAWSAAGTGFSAPDTSFIFEDFILPFTAYYFNDTMWIPQWKGVDVNPPFLLGVDFSDYKVDKVRQIQLGIEQITTTEVDKSSNLVFLGSRTGYIQVRNANSYTQNVICTFQIQDASIAAFSYDSVNKRLFVVFDHEDGVKMARLDVSLDFPYWDGTIIDPLAGPEDQSFYTTITVLLKLGSASAMTLDTATGTGFVSMVDSTGIGYLAKVNLRTGELVVVYLPIQRENSKMSALYSETTVNGERLLYTISTYTIAVFNYSTSCSLDCNEVTGNGICIDGKCNCTGDWWGLSCSTRACKPGCGDFDEPFRGECIDGACVCQANFTGEGCQDRRCPNDCSGNGDCVGNYTCECKDVRTGIDCSELRFQTCDELNDYIDIDSRQSACLDLTQYLGCGYCGGGHSRCVVGNRAGPMNNSCMWWFYDGGFNPAFMVFLIIIMIAWIVMYLLNATSAMIEDLEFSKLRQTHNSSGYYGTKGYQKRLWWRDERSIKSWKLFDQMQFLSAYGIINALFTTELYNFLTFWNWSLFLIPWGGDMYLYQYDETRAFNYTPPAPIVFPFPPIPESAFGGGGNSTKRNADYVLESRKRDYEQFINSVESKGEMIFPTFIIWVMIVMTFCLLGYGLYYLIITKCVHAGKKHYAKIHELRIVHVFFRVLHAAYFPAIFLGVFAIQVEQKPIIILAIVVGLIFIGIGLPLSFWFLTKGEMSGSTKTDWFEPGLRIRFGSFYASYKKERVRFQFFVFFRKAWMGCSLGAMARGYNPESASLFWAQMIVTLIAFVAYLIFLFWRRPYIDMVHIILDSITNVLNGITLLLSLLAIQSDAGTQRAIQWIVLIFQIPCVLLVIVTYFWSCIFYYGYLSPRQFFCCEKPTIEGDDAELMINTGDTQKPKVNEGDEIGDDQVEKMFAKAGGAQVV